MGLCQVYNSDSDCLGEMKKKKYVQYVQCGMSLKSSPDKGLKSRNVFGLLTFKVHLFKQLKWKHYHTIFVNLPYSS